MIVYERREGVTPPPHLDLTGLTCFHCGRSFSPNSRAVMWFRRGPDQTGSSDRIALHPKCSYVLATEILNQLPHIAYGTTPAPYNKSLGEY